MKSHTLLALRRVAMLYAVLAIARIIFLIYNLSLMGEVESWWMLLKGSLQFDTVSILYSEGLWLVLALLPLPLILREHRYWQVFLFWLYTIVGAVVLAINFSDIVYFYYTQKRFTADEVFFADNSNSLQLMLKFAIENWYLVLAWGALVWLLVWGYGRKISPQSPIRKWWAYYPTALLILAIVAGLSIGGIRGGFTRMTRPITLSNATLYAPNSAQSNLILSNPFCILRTYDSNSKIEVPDYFPQEVADTIFTPYHTPIQESRFEELRGRNVVVFIMESMSAEHSALLRPDLYTERGEEGYTPFLDSLMQQGLYLKNMYANGRRSIQAMPSVLGSIPSLKTPFVLMPQSLGESRQMPRILRDKGYHTAFFCGSESGSMGFGAYARSAGVEQLFALEDYEARHGKGDFDGYWGIWDDRFLDFVGEELSQFSEPFFASVFTLSSHHPFVVPERFKDQLPKGHTPIQPCAAYEDMSFELFFEKYGNEEWLKRTIFVFVADHVSSERYSEEAKVWPGIHHIISFIYAPDSELKGCYEGITQQIDIMPTVLNMVGVDEPFFAFGRDILNENKKPEWSVSYENGYQVMTPQGALVIPEESIPDDETGRALKAFIQQYYKHISEKSYVVR